MSFKVITLFPSAFPGPLGVSVLEKSRAKNLWSLDILSMRDHYQINCRVDHPPFGGGPGMIIRADVLGPVLECATSGDWQSSTLLFLSPRGRQFDQVYASDIAKKEKVILVCGRFEGIDQRIIDFYKIKEISVGPYILAGGEIAAMTVIETCVRLVPGVIGNPKSLESETFASSLDLEYDQYTKPRIWKEMAVPDVLLSGNHQEIKKWKSESSAKKSRGLDSNQFGKKNN